MTGTNYEWGTVVVHALRAQESKPSLVIREAQYADLRCTGDGGVEHLLCRHEQAQPWRPLAMHVPPVNGRLHGKRLTGRHKPDHRSGGRAALDSAFPWWRSPAVASPHRYWDSLPRSRCARLVAGLYQTQLPRAVPRRTAGRDGGSVPYCQLWPSSPGSVDIPKDIQVALGELETALLHC